MNYEQMWKDFRKGLEIMTQSDDEGARIVGLSFLEVMDDIEQEERDNIHESKTTDM